MRITQQWMIDAFKEINEKYFDGEIKSELILVVDHDKKTSVFGQYNKKKKSITLYDSHDEVETSWKEILAHEMIHKLLDDNNIDCLHGKEFKEKARELYNKGLLVTTTVTYNTTPKDKTLECLTIEDKLVNNNIFDKLKVTSKGKLFINGVQATTSTFDIIRDICEDKSLTEQQIKDIINKLKGEKTMPTTTTVKPKAKSWRDYIIWKEDKYGEDTSNAENISDNYEAYLEHNPKYKGRIKYNEYRKQIEFNFGIRSVDFTTEEDRWMPINNIVYSKIHADIDSDLHISSRPKVEDAIEIVADNHKYHEVIDYFNELCWDHKKRVETFFIDWLKADDTPLNREMTKLWFIAAVKRMVDPGCKFDNILITVGEQGSGKSWLIEKLSNGFGYETNIRIDKEQEYGQKLDNTWFAVFDELANLSKKEASEIKKWFSITMDTFRSPYARVPEVHKRHCVYYGTTNDDYFLRDYTARCERRYWTIKCYQTKIESWEKFKNFTQDVIDQIWAEAVELYKENPDVSLDIQGEYYDMLEEVQKQFKTSNEDTIAESLENMLNGKYVLDENGFFKDDRDCVNQMKGKPRDMMSNEHIGHINVIPSRQIKLILKEILHDVRKHKYFENETSGFYNRWEINVFDNKIGTRVYKRKTFMVDEIVSQNVEDTWFS